MSVNRVLKHQHKAVVEKSSGINKRKRSRVWDRREYLGYLMGYVLLVFMYIFPPSGMDKSMVLRVGFIFTTAIILITFLKIVLMILTQSANKRKAENIKPK